MRSVEPAVKPLRPLWPRTCSRGISTDFGAHSELKHRAAVRTGNLHGCRANYPHFTAARNSQIHGSDSVAFLLKPAVGNGGPGLGGVDPSYPSAFETVKPRYVRLDVEHSCAVQHVDGPDPQDVSLHPNELDTREAYGIRPCGRSGREDTARCGVEVWSDHLLAAPFDPVKPIEQPDSLKAPQVLEARHEFFEEFH